MKNIYLLIGFQKRRVALFWTVTDFTWVGHFSGAWLALKHAETCAGRELRWEERREDASLWHCQLTPNQWLELRRYPLDPKAMDDVPYFHDSDAALKENYV